MYWFPLNVIGVFTQNQGKLYEDISYVLSCVRNLYQLQKLLISYIYRCLRDIFLQKTICSTEYSINYNYYSSNY